MISQNQIRIAMWSGPRNISTAMMRSFENRKDTFVIDEPFYAYYLSKTGFDHPGREDVLKSQSTKWKDVVNLIIGDIPDKKLIWYQKHMVHHISNNRDIGWVKFFNNCFLIRHPKDVIISFAKQSPINGINDLGYIQQVNLFKKINNITGKYPLVFDAKDILTDPENYLRMICQYFKISFSKKMLNWPKGLRVTDGIWSPYWYKNVINSNSFNPYKKSLESIPNQYKNLLDECLPYYDYLYSFKK